MLREAETELQSRGGHAAHPLSAAAEAGNRRERKKSMYFQAGFSTAALPATATRATHAQEVSPELPPSALPNVVGPRQLHPGSCGYRFPPFISSSMASACAMVVTSLMRIEGLPLSRNWHCRAWAVA